tara:strand:+ start:99 stop:341 length:243 start_codon:yes stop_codon:yes gene_type:complete
MNEEMTIRKLAEKIITDFELTIKDRVDSVLELSAIAETNTGIDSTKAEKNKVKQDNKYLYKLINSIDEVTGKQLLKTIDA